MKQVKFKFPVRLLALMCGLFLTVNAFAQQIAVKGLVKDATGEPVIGATVRIADGSGGAVTDFDGNFTLNVKAGTKLQISYIGYDTQEVVAKDGMIVVLKEDAGQSLNEVVVIGYGVAKKNDLTGSVTAIKPDEKNKGLVVNAQDLIQGKIAGVNVNTTTGEPGGGAQIRIRGGASLTASNNPLIVIDGMPMDNNNTKGMENPLSLVNPNDIESFTVLKDASATAIYGSRGANGVILVTTKSGKSGKVNVSYNAYYSWKSIAKTMDVLSPYDYAKWQYELALLNNPNDISSYTDFFGNYRDLDMYQNVAANDWQDIVYGRTGHTFNQSLNITGGSETVKYAFSYAHMNDKAIQIGSNFKRDNFSLKLNTKPTKNTASACPAAAALPPRWHLPNGAKPRPGI